MCIRSISLSVFETNIASLESFLAGKTLDINWIRHLFHISPGFSIYKNLHVCDYTDGRTKGSHMSEAVTAHYNALRDLSTS
jgi:hypothetical protein